MLPLLACALLLSHGHIAHLVFSFQGFILKYKMKTDCKLILESIDYPDGQPFMLWNAHAQKYDGLLLAFAPLRQERAGLAQTSPPSPTSWHTGTTCSFRPLLRPTSRYVLASTLQELPKRSVLSVDFFSAVWYRYFRHHWLWGDRDSEGLLHHARWVETSPFSGVFNIRYVLIPAVNIHSEVCKEPTAVLCQTPQCCNERSGHRWGHAYSHHRGSLWGKCFCLSKHTLTVMKEQILQFQHLLDSFFHL